MTWRKGTTTVAVLHCIVFCGKAVRLVAVYYSMPAAFLLIGFGAGVERTLVATQRNETILFWLLSCHSCRRRPIEHYIDELFRFVSEF